MVKFRVLVITLCFAIVILVAASWRAGRVHGLWYRRTGSETAFYRALYLGTSAGQSRTSLEDLLGTGNTLSAASSSVLVRLIKKWESEGRRDVPDGYREGDVFVQFKVGPLLENFQFRDGRLVNHNPLDYAVRTPFTPLGGR